MPTNNFQNISEQWGKPSHAFSWNLCIDIFHNFTEFHWVFDICGGYLFVFIGVNVFKMFLFDKFSKYTLSAKFNDQGFTLGWLDNTKNWGKPWKTKITRPIQ